MRLRDDVLVQLLLQMEGGREMLAQWGEILERSQEEKFTADLAALQRDFDSP